MGSSLKKNEQIIVNNVGVANHFSERLIGMMFKKAIDSDEGLYIPNCRSVHTFFVRFDLDLVWVNKQLEIVKLVDRMKTWRMSSIVFKAYGVIELAPGTIGKSNLKVGDRLTLENMS
jgi:uncharacterized membrane protein (UPF0127 family)